MAHLSDQRKHEIAELLTDGSASSAAELQDVYPDAEIFEIEAAAAECGVTTCTKCGEHYYNEDLDKNGRCPSCQTI